MSVNDDGLFIKHVIQKDNLYGVFTDGESHYFLDGVPRLKFEVFVTTTSPNVVLTRGLMYWILSAARKLAADLK